MNKYGMTPRQLAFQRANGMAKAEAELAAASLLAQPYVCSTERLGALFLACMRAGVVIYPDAVGFDSVRGVNFDAVGALPPNETCGLYVEKQRGMLVGEELELVMLRALAFVALSGGECGKNAYSAERAEKAERERLRMLLTERDLAFIEEGPENLARVEAELKSMSRPQSAPWPGFNEEGDAL